MSNRLRVYVSSPYNDLQQHRQAVIAALRMAGYDCDAMEDYPAFDERTLRFCLDDVEKCDIYVLILAHRYGSRPPEEENPDNKSITELEYRHAGACSPKKKQLVFLVDPDHDWPEEYRDDRQAELAQDAAERATSAQDAADLAVLKKELRSWDRGVGGFTSPDHLASLVLAAISRTAEPLRIRPMEHLDSGAYIQQFTGREEELARYEAELRKALEQGTALAL